MAKNKIKTNKTIAKRLNVRPGGTIAIGHAAGNHNTGKKSRRQVRNQGITGTLSKADQNRIKNVKVK